MLEFHNRRLRLPWCSVKGLIVCYRLFKVSVSGPQRNSCVCLYVELYSTWSPVGGMCLVTCSNVQYMPRSEEGRMFKCTVSCLQRLSRMFKCTWFTFHILIKTHNQNGSWPYISTIGAGITWWLVTRLRAGRFRVRIHAVAVDFSFHQSLSIGMGSIQPHFQLLHYLRWSGRDADLNLVPLRRRVKA
jgi:hypothetical protein